MDVLTAIKERRSCRAFSNNPISKETLDQVLEAATWAPSPLNAQPWSFVVVTADEIKKKIVAEAGKSREWAVEKSGWGWLGKYDLDFLASVPAIIAVAGDPRKSGVDQFSDEGSKAYEHACAAAVQNMLLAAHALGLGTLWFTMFDRDRLAQILSLDTNKVPLALVCLGKATADPAPAPRKPFADRTVFLE